MAMWSWIAATSRRLSFRAHRASLDEELRDEMQFHIDMLARDNEARGMTPEAAREAARRQFGSSTMLREASRMHWSLGWIDALWQDVRYGIRSLIRTAGVTVTALLTLTLGIGATVMVVALVDATLLHPIALRDVDRIVTICQTNAGPSCQQLATGNYVSIRSAPTALKDAALMQYWSATVSGRDGATVATGAVVTPNYFAVLGVTPFLGRSFTRADADASASQPAVVILSYGFWRGNFNADPGIIGRSVEIGGVPVTVIGVLRKDDGFPAGVDMWGPLQLTASAAADRESENSMVFGRLRPGATVADAARDVSGVQRQLIRESPSTNAGWRFVTAPLKQFRVADYRPSVLLITAAVIGVLLIACANVGNLQLVRTLARERELAVRAALGAGRAQLARQLVIEGLLLALTGGAAGVMVGEFGLAETKHIVPAYLTDLLPGLSTMSINWRVLALMLGVCVAIGVGLSAFPAFRAARTDLTGALKQGARGGTTGRKAARVRTTLVVSEIALAVMLVTGAALLIQSFTKLSAANTGLQSHHVLTMHLTVPSTFDEARVEKYHHTILRRLETLPGVRNAALVNLLPLSGHNI
ncbi:MAG TPA: ABC transporter permease, partial [Gemmatimonadaceae bacterium]|nr:ABC transporter permease [Gemmatimonadaceae bacterium]